MFPTSSSPKAKSGPYHSSYVRPGRAGSCWSWAGGCGAHTPNYMNRYICPSSLIAPKPPLPPTFSQRRRRVNAMLCVVARPLVQRPTGRRPLTLVIFDIVLSHNLSHNIVCLSLISHVPLLPIKICVGQYYLDTFRLTRHPF